jgi:riboflavin kinase/FMN adenylyltransferase
VNFGFAPTFSSLAWAEPVIEAHFLGEVPKIPERGVKTEFLRFIRPEKKFSSIDDLKEQILIDKASCLNTPMKR